MGNNPIPSNNGQLTQMANNMLAGVTQLGASLGITQITPEAFQAILTAFVNADNAFDAARSARQTVSDDYHAAAKALAEWLEVVRNVLAAHFGVRWNTMWAQAGFINNKAAVPTKLADRLALGQKLVTFLTANPSYEVADLGVTAAHGSELTDTTTTALQAWNDAIATSHTTKSQDATTRAALVFEMRLLIQILQKLLGPSDGRWSNFGLVMPSANTTPGQPVNVAASLDASGNILVSCDAVPLATRYRWRMLLVGVEDKYTLATSTVAPLGVIKGVLPGQTVQIIAQAVNVNQQGVASEPIEFTVPPVAAARPPVESTLAVTAKGHGHGHGNGNGNGNGHRATSRVR